jgi:hypothetical protein
MMKNKKQEDKKHYLNLNVYTTTHRFTRNKVKIKFTEEVLPLIAHLPKLAKMSVTYVIYPRTNAASDTNNICSIVDKFFLDTLVAGGVIVDDNHTIVVSTTNLYGSKDKDNPRCEAIITDLGNQ